MNEGGGAGRPTVAVVGGGIAGLAAAWELAQAPDPVRVVVFEASARLGGRIVSADFADRHVPLGPDAFVARRPEAVALCRAVGLGDELVAPGARGASLWSGGRLRALPDGLAIGVPTRLGPLARSGILSPGGLGRVAADLAAPRWWAPAELEDDEAIGSLLARRLGREVVDKLADPLIGGIHAGPVDTMSTAAVFPALLQAAQRRGSLARNLRHVAPATDDAGDDADGTDEVAPVFLTVRGGLARLVERLAATLSARGVETRTGASVRGLRRGAGARWSVDTGHEALEADAVVVALPAPDAAAVLGPADTELARRFGSVTSASVALVTMRFAATDVGAPLEGTGFLVPRAGGAHITACTYLSVKWPELSRPGDVLLRASAGRAGDDRALALDDDALVARATDELGPMLELTGPPDKWTVTRHVEGFPQYEVGHVEWVRAVEEAAERAGGLAVAGATLRGVGIPACIAGGRRAARLALAHLPPASAG